MKDFSRIVNSFAVSELIEKNVYVELPPLLTMHCAREVKLKNFRIYLASLQKKTYRAKYDHILFLQEKRHSQDLVYF